MNLPAELIKNELKIFETRFKEAVRSQAPYWTGSCDTL